MDNYDVIVVGLGAMGSATADHLARRGLRVLGLEKFGPAHDQGSSHGGSRIIRQAYFEDPAYVPLLLRAYELWDELEVHSGDDGLLTRTGGLMIGPPDSLTVSGSRESAQQWGLAHEMLDAAQIRARFPLFTPKENEVALYEANAGFVRPERTVSAQLKVARAHGADLHFAEPMRDWSASGSGVRVQTDLGTYSAAKMVICPGAWAPRLLTDIGVPFVVQRQIQYWFAPTGGTAPFEPHRQPIYVWEDAAGVQIYGFPAQDGPDGGVKIAFFRKGIECTPETIDRTVHPHEIQAMRNQVADKLPDLPGGFLRAATCMYTNTPDEHFVLATHPGCDAVTVGAGFSGHGFKFVPVIGEILADLCAEGRTEHPIGLFDPARFHDADALIA